MGASQAHTERPNDAPQSQGLLTLIKQRRPATGQTDSMNRPILILLGVALTVAAHAADPVAKAMVDKSCTTCHAGSFGGDGSSVYTRETRKVKTKEDLISQVKLWAGVAGTNWNAAQIDQVSQYLDEQYYKLR